MLAWLGRRVARYLSKTRPWLASAPCADPLMLAHSLRRGDVLLVDGTSRFSTAIKYITQSSWSHAALVTAVGDTPQACQLVEADVLEGVRVVTLAEYVGDHTRICRPVGLVPEDIETIVAYACARIGYRYDLRNVFDLARYLISTPPTPTRWRRSLFALGSGAPTRAICSSLIAQCFQAVQYPVLPKVDPRAGKGPACDAARREFLHICHHGLFAPRDFDISPYFQIVKPNLSGFFDPYALIWEPTYANNRALVSLPMSGSDGQARNTTRMG